MSGILIKKKDDYLIFEYEEKSYLKIYNFLNMNNYKIFYLVRNEDILVNSLEKYPKFCKKVLNFIAVSPDKVDHFIAKFNLDNLN